MWDEVVSMVNISMLIISTIWLMFDLSVSCVPRPCLYMLGSSSLTQVFRMCKTGLHPLYVNVESITPDHHVVLQNDLLSQWCTLGEITILSWNFSEGSPYNATIILSKIRCIKRLHHMQIISGMIWPSTCAFDLHLQSTDMISIVTGITPWSPSSCRLRGCHANHASTTIATA